MHGLERSVRRAGPGLPPDRRNGRRGYRWRFLAVALFACSLLHVSASAAEHVILYLSRAGSVREVFAQERPELQKILSNGAVAVMTIGPSDIDPLATLRAGRYISVDDPQPPSGYAPGVLPIFEPPENPAAGDSLLRDMRRQYPDAPVVALHAGPWKRSGVHGIAESLTVPSWVAISTMHGRPYTETTRRAGIVSNLDIAPTLYRMLNDKAPAGLPGRPMWGEDDAPRPTRHGVPYQVAAAMSLQDALLTLARATMPVNFALAFGGIALLFLAAWRLVRKGARNRWLQYLLVGGMVATVGVAMAAGRTPASLAAYETLAIGATVALWITVLVAGHVLSFAPADLMPSTLQISAGAITTYIAVDTLRGGFPLALSPLSNLYLTGIRFYGLGNEYAALFLACGVIAALATVQRTNAPRMSVAGLTLLGIWMLLLCLLVGWSGAGANMGGMLTGFITGGIAWYLAARRSGARHAWVWPLVASLITFSAVVWIDAHSAHATHVGRFVQSAAQDPATPLAILANKAAIQWHLFTAPPAFAIYACAIALVLLVRGPLAVSRARLFRRYPWIGIGIPSLLIGGAFGMVLNDTGIVMWGLMASVALATAALMALEPAAVAIINE